ncbi:MAG TPA: amino acid ABC transporter substrate-binding protein [Gemmatimonadales bacterium]|nr:amino acid ABC transporter substrate-binding protein [Gemmatimonadales bacterium]
MSRTIKTAACAIVCLAIAAPAAPTGPLAAQQSGAAASPTLTRIKQSGRIRFGYQSDARPFSYRDQSGNAAGFTVALCKTVAGAVKDELGVQALSVEWIAVGPADRFTAVSTGKVDAFCGADTDTWSRRAAVAFSLPVFPGGIGALLRKDAPERLSEILNQKPPSNPTWRASAGQLLQTQTFTVIKGTTAEPWLNGKVNEFKLTSKIAPVTSYDAGITAVLDRSASVFFGDRSVLLDAITHHPSGSKLEVLDRLFTYEAFALPLPRGDEGFRALVDRALSRLYPTPEFRALYVESFGEPTADVVTFYRWNTRPE